MSLRELWEIRSRFPQSRLFAGGTDLFVQRRYQTQDESPLIGLERIQELRTTAWEGDTFTVGAATPIRQLLEDDSVQTLLPVLAQGLACMGGPALRNMATIGGNLCTASPAGDSLPPLYVLGADVVLHSEFGRRSLPIKEFILGPGSTSLRCGEILHSIKISRPPPGSVQWYQKVGQRKANAIAIVSLAVLGRSAPDGGFQSIRLAWGSVGPTVITSREAEACLESSPLTMEKVNSAAQTARQAVAPIDDIRASAEYRRMLSGNLVYRLLR